MVHNHGAGDITPPLSRIRLYSSPSGAGTVSVTTAATVTSGKASIGTAVTVYLNSYTTDGYTFDGWTVDGVVVSTDLQYTFIVTGNVGVTAKFTPKKVTLSVSVDPSAGGTTNAINGTYDYGSYQYLAATPNSGYKFVGWYSGTTCKSTYATYNFPLTGNTILVAKFAVTPRYTIALSVDPPDAGTASGAGIYNEGDTASISVSSSNSNYSFQGWHENGTRFTYSTSTSFAVTANRTLVAKYTGRSYTITANTDSSTKGTVSGGGSYEYGKECTLVATPKSTSYWFDCWKEGSTVVSSDATYTFTVTGARRLTAYWKSAEPLCDITVTGSSTTYTELIGTGKQYRTFPHTIEAKMKPGWKFYRWKLYTDYKYTYIEENPYTFTVTGKMEFTLQAREDTTPSETTYTITATASPTNGGTVTGGGTYNKNASVTLKATAAAGYVFDHWEQNGYTITSSDAKTETYTFTATANGTYAAVFVPVVAIWKKAASTVSGDSVAFGNNKFVTVGSNNYVYYSTDGNTWTSTTLPGSAHGGKVVFGGGKFVVSPNPTSPTNTVYYSSDGVSWYSATLPKTAYWKGLAYGNNKFILAARGDSSSNYSSYIAYSSNGSTWYSATLPVSIAAVCVSYGNKFLLFGRGSSNASYLLYSTNGTSWSYTTSSVSLTDNMSIAYGANRWVLSNSSGLATFYHSTDGTSWTSNTLSQYETISGTKYYSDMGPMFYANGKFLLLPEGSNATISTHLLWFSTDGTTWKSGPVIGKDSNEFVYNPTFDAYGVAYGNGRWVAPGWYCEDP